MTSATTTRLTVIDLFAGAGGFGLGFRLAGFHLVLSLEIDAWAAQTLKRNDPKMNVVVDDIRRFQSSLEVNALCPWSPDVIIGGPPCQGFSVAGPANKDPMDPRNSLFLDYARWVEYLQPKVFVMENVKGLLRRHNAQGDRVIQIIQRTFEELGYSTEVWLLNSAEYGVPQIRERIFVVGNRLGIGKLGEPERTHVVSVETIGNLRMPLFDWRILPPALSVWDAISDLPELNAGEGEEKQCYTFAPTTDYQIQMRGQSAVLFNHVAMQHTPRLVERFKHVSWGESSADVPEEYRARSRNGNGKLSTTMYDQNNRRLDPSKPSHTIAASFYANFIHPFQHRNLTAREGARLQSFPDWYQFMGKKTTPSHKLLQREGRLEEKHLCQYNQIGNAVPPLLAKAIAVHIQEVMRS